MFLIPAPELQVHFSEALVQAQQDFLQEALAAAVAASEIQVLDEEAHALVPSEALRLLASRGLRAEVVFALPSLLSRNPRLLAYYRLVLGFSQKEFYASTTGLSPYKRAEDGLGFRDAQLAGLRELCAALNTAAAFLVSAIAPALTKQHVRDLSLLTFGPQLRGSRNVALGVAAISRVFRAIAEIVGDRGIRSGERKIGFTDSTGRPVEVRFGSDPDIEVVSIGRGARRETPLLAVEVKGGTDFSNVHNRLGEAEKSHLKAKARGFTDLWTVTNVQGLTAKVRRGASPTTTSFFDLSDIVSRKGRGYQTFREQLLQKLRLPPEWHEVGRAAASTFERGRVRGLIEANPTAARQPHRRCQPPGRLQDFCAHYVLVRERLNERAHIVAHQVEHAPEERMLGVKLHEIAVRRVHAKLGGGQREDEPTLARIDGSKSQYVAEKDSIRFRVFAVQENVGADQHGWSIPPVCASRPSRPCQPRLTVSSR
jgi:hypothetical protein